MKHTIYIPNLQLFAEGGEAAAGASPVEEAPAQAEQEAQPQTPPDPRQEGASLLAKQWEQEAASAKERFPSLDLRRELGNPAFCRLLKAGVDVESAYVALHRHEILPAAMHHAAMLAQQRLAGAIAAGANRPRENGLGSSTAATVPDVRHMTKKQRSDICRRAAQGEKIRF